MYNSCDEGYYKYSPVKEYTKVAAGGNLLASNGEAIFIYVYVSYSWIMQSEEAKGMNPSEHAVDGSKGRNFLINLLMYISIYLIDNIIDM